MLNHCFLFVFIIPFFELIFDLCFCSSLSWMKQIVSWMLVFRRNWDLSFSAYQKIDKTCSFLQQLQVICKSCVNVTKIRCMSMRLMKALKQLKHLSNRLYSSLKRWRMYIWCIFWLKWKIWEFGLPLYLSQHAGIFLDDLLLLLANILHNPAFLFICLIL